MPTWIDEMTDGSMAVYDLGRQLFNGMPQSPHHPTFLHTVPRRHGDAVREDGGAGANDLLVMGTHIGTHIDALAHVSYRGMMHQDEPVGDLGGVPYDRLGAHQIEPVIARGLLLDIPATLGTSHCEASLEVTPAHLEEALARTGTDTRPGDVLLVRTGWGMFWDDGPTFLGETTGTPGVRADGARWLAAQRPLAVGSDTMPFEWLPPGEVRGQPAHRILIVEAGVHIVEMLALEELADAGVHEFLFVLLSLPIHGATGSPARPVALVRP